LLSLGRSMREGFFLMPRVYRLSAVTVVALVVLATAVAASALSTSGKAGAPGLACKHLKVQGKKTDQQRAAFQSCIADAVAKRTSGNARKETDDQRAKSRRSGTAGKAGAPGQVCKDLKVKGKKTVGQRAAFKKCIQDAVSKRK
jgi:hypothetical protein